MKQVAIPAFCIFHLLAISWWTLPHTFSNLVLAEENPQSYEYKLVKYLSVIDQSWLGSLFNAYIDVTGSQQYWDFFAPHSSRHHQYLSVCSSIAALPDQEIINCKDEPLFSNLSSDFAEFKLNGSNRSRWYRLTENLITLDDPVLLKAFAQYYRQLKPDNLETSVYLIAHQFELQPELTALPRPGYRSDKLLLSLP